MQIGQVALCALGVVLSIGCGARTAPTPLEVDHVVEVVAGAYQTCARTEAGAVYCWGLLERGPGAPFEPTPVRLPVPPATSVDVDNQWCAVTAEGAHCQFNTGIGVVRLPAGETPRVVLLGRLLVGERAAVLFNDDGCLRLPCSDEYVPHHLERAIELVAPSGRLRSASCKLATEELIRMHAFCALDEEGRLSALPYPEGERVRTSASRFRSVRTEAGGHTCGVYMDGRAVCQLAPMSLALPYVVEPLPVPVADAIDIIPLTNETPYGSTEPGVWGGCALRTDGTVWCWGSNLCDLNTRITGEEVPLPNDCDYAVSAEPRRIGLRAAVHSITGWGDHVCALLVDHSVWCWGANLYAVLGNGTRADSDVPVRVIGLPGPP